MRAAETYRANRDKFERHPKRKRGARVRAFVRDQKERARQAREAEAKAAKPKKPRAPRKPRVKKEAAS